MSEENRRLKSAPAMAAAATVSDDGSIAPSVTPSPRGEHAPSPASPVKPCPFCASTKLRAKDDAEQGYKWGAIECEECSARGPEVRTGYDKPEKWRPAAIEEWNRRTPAPSPATGESARTASKDASKELDELLAVFAKGDDDDEDCWTQPARRAQLYVASLRAEVERLEKRVTNLLSGTVESFEDGTLTILPHREMTTRIASALAGILDECEAPNYVQMILSRAGEPGEPRKRYVVTVQRPEGKTPHQLREDAEKERDAIRQEVDRLRTEHARLVAVINDDGSLENIDDIVSIAEDAMHAYNVQNKLIEENVRLRTALAEKEKAGVNANAVVERCIELVVRKKTPSWDEVSVWCDALRTALGAKEIKENNNGKG